MKQLDSNTNKAEKPSTSFELSGLSEDRSTPTGEASPKSPKEYILQNIIPPPKASTSNTSQKHSGNSKELELIPEVNECEESKLSMQHKSPQSSGPMPFTALANMKNYPSSHHNYSPQLNKSTHSSASVQNLFRAPTLPGLFQSLRRTETLLHKKRKKSPVDPMNIEFFNNIRKPSNIPKDSVYPSLSSHSIEEQINSSPNPLDKWWINTLIESEQHFRSPNIIKLGKEHTSGNPYAWYGDNTLPRPPPPQQSNYLYWLHKQTYACLELNQCIEILNKYIEGTENGEIVFEMNNYLSENVMLLTEGLGLNPIVCWECLTQFAPDKNESFGPDCSFFNINIIVYIYILFIYRMKTISKQIKNLFL